MPIIKSAAKRMRQNKTRYKQNLAVKRQMRQAVKELGDLIGNKQEKKAREQFSTAQKTIDKAVKKGVLHKNTAARRKSQLARQIDTVFGTKKAAATKSKTAKKPAKKTTAKAAPPKKTAKTTKKPAAKTKKS